MNIYNTRQCAEDQQAETDQLGMGNRTGSDRGSGTGKAFNNQSTAEAEHTQKHNMREIG